MTTFERILVATDFSAASQPALDEAAMLAREGGTTLLILHAYCVHWTSSVRGASGADYAEFKHQVRAGREKQMDEALAHARSRGASARGLLREGLPDDQILAAAEAEGADLIVMGTHGRRGFSRMLLGSVAAGVVGRARCPVMTLRGEGVAEASRA